MINELTPQGPSTPLPVTAISAASDSVRLAASPVVEVRSSVEELSESEITPELLRSALSPFLNEHVGEDDAPFFRVQALGVLGKIGSPEEKQSVLKDLERTLNNPPSLQGLMSYGIMGYAATALGEVAGREARDILLSFLENKLIQEGSYRDRIMQQVTSSVIKALAKIKESDSELASDIETVFQKILDQPKFRNSYLVRIINYEKNKKVEPAKIQDRSDLKRMLENEDPYKVIEAAKNLARLGEKALVKKALCPFLNSEKPGIVFGAVEALHTILVA